MSVSLLATLAKGGVMDIGHNTRPIEPERERFKTLTRGSMVVMGRKTYNMYGTILGAYNIVLTNNQRTSLKDSGVVYHTIEEVIKFSQKANVVILGGHSIFHQFIKYADRIYITELDLEVEGSMYFPSLEEFVLEDVNRYNLEGYSARSLLTYVKASSYVDQEKLNDKELYI